MRNYLKNLSIAFSQLLNAIIFGCPDETLGARAYRNAFYGNIVAKIIVVLLDGVFFILTRDLNHCKNLYEEEVLDNQKHKDYDV